MSPEDAANRSAATSSNLRMAVLGNCQMGHFTRCLQALLGGEWPTNEWINFRVLAEMVDGRRDLTAYFDRHDKVFMQPWIWDGMASRYSHFQHKVVLYPNFDFLAYHPDLVYVTNAAADDHFVGPCGHYQSSLALLAWKAGLSSTDALKLFHGDVYRRLGFFDFWDNSSAALRAEIQAAGLPESLLDRWIERGCFMHSVNHPKLFVVADVVSHLLHRLGIETLPGNPLQFVRDYLADSIVWPVYPEIGEHLGIPGNHVFKLSSPGLQPDQPVRMLDLERFVAESYAAFSPHAPQDLVCSRLELPPYRDLAAELDRSRAGVRPMDPVVAAPRLARGPEIPMAIEASKDLADPGWLEESRLLFRPGSAFWLNAA